MKRFWVGAARYFLRPKQSNLWWIAGVTYGLGYQYVGLWAVLWLFITAIITSTLEVWWNEYADDYDDLRDVE